LPGSGINAETVGPLLDHLLPYGLKEIHLSAGAWIDNGAEYRKEGFGMGVGEGEWGVWRTDEEKVREVKRIVEEKTRMFEDQQQAQL
jgi:copper homeostasis protein